MRQIHAEDVENRCRFIYIFLQSRWNDKNGQTCRNKKSTSLLNRYYEH